MMKPVLPKYRHAAAAGTGGRRHPLGSHAFHVGPWLAMLLLTAVVTDLLLRPACTGCGVAGVTNYFVFRADVDGAADPRPPHRPHGIRRSNGYLRVSCIGGLNQMRSAICDMVAIASYLKLTLLVPELDKGSYWADPSDFEDIFDLEHFIDSLRDRVQIVRALPADEGAGDFSVLRMAPKRWSNETYYTEEILPLFEKHGMVHFNRTDFRLANNGLPVELQKLRCRANYEALRFTPTIQALGEKLISILRGSGRFVVLHLRYEMDMLAFSGCARGCTDEETMALTKMRYSRPLWIEKEIDSEKKRSEGLCPLTPEEVTLVLQAMGFGPDTLIYIAAGETYAGERRLATLKAAFPRLVKKEMLLSEDDLRPLKNHLSQMAALDYIASLESDVFIPTYGGNMAKLVEGHRRYMGFRKTILFDRKQLVQLLDSHQNGTLSWDQFAYAVREVHRHRIGGPARRKVIVDQPREEDYFHANPYECLPPVSSRPRI